MTPAFELGIAASKWIGLAWKNNPMWKGQRRSNRSTFACHRMSFFNSVWTFVLCVLRFLRNGYRCDQVVLSSQVALKRQQWPADSRSACSWRHALDSSSMPCDMATIWFRASPLETPTCSRAGRSVCSFKCLFATRSLCWKVRWIPNFHRWFSAQIDCTEIVSDSIR